MRNNQREQNWLSVRRAKRVQQTTLDNYVKVRPSKEQSSTLTNFLSTKQKCEDIREIAVFPKPIPILGDSQAISLSPTSLENTPSNDELPAIITLSSSQSCKNFASVEKSPFIEASTCGVVITSVPNKESSPSLPTSTVPSIIENSALQTVIASPSPAPQSSITKNDLSLNDSLFNDSYDFPVKPNVDRKFAFKADPTRKKDERKKLCGHACHCCKAYFDALELSPEEKERRINAVSRHRDFQAPPSTPDHFWEVGFPSTAEIMERKKRYYGDVETNVDSSMKNPRNKLYTRRRL